MKTKIIFVIMLIMTGLTSCYDDVFDTYDDSVVYKLRDRGPAGGWIFYINPNYREDGWRYLEAAPEDLSSKEWSTTSASISGAKDTAIGAGKGNTSSISNYDKNDDNAANECLAYTVNNGGIEFNDWFLPSKDELWYMCWNLQGVYWDASIPGAVNNPDFPAGSVGGFSNSSYYWSSSEDDSIGNFAWFQDFNFAFPGAQTSNSKAGQYCVRPIRAF